jgi:hypothetical protein
MWWLFGRENYREAHSGSGRSNLQTCAFFDVSL